MQNHARCKRTSHNRVPGRAPCGNLPGLGGLMSSYWMQGLLNLVYGIAILWLDGRFVTSRRNPKNNFVWVLNFTMVQVLGAGSPKAKTTHPIAHQIACVMEESMVTPASKDEVINSHNLVSHNLSTGLHNADHAACAQFISRSFCMELLIRWIQFSSSGASIFLLVFCLFAVRT